jgi:glycerophosphoryl diester phosphodiesterase
VNNVRDDSEGPSGPSSSSPNLDSSLQAGAGRILTVAHRAGNDRAALERALSAGVDAVEADLRWDGGRIVARHARRLPFLPLFWDRWYLRGNRSAQLTLDELLKQVKGRARPYLDLKALARPFPRALLDALRRHDALAESTVSSEHWDLLAELRRREPDLRLVRSVNSRRRRAALLALTADDRRLAGVAVQRDLLDDALARRLRAEGLALYVWGIDDSEDARRAIGWGATGLIADSLELLRAAQAGA